MNKKTKQQRNKEVVSIQVSLTRKEWEGLFDVCYDSSTEHNKALSKIADLYHLAEDTLRQDHEEQDDE